MRLVTNNILCDHRCSYLVNAIMFNTKKAIFNAKIGDLIPALVSVNNVLQNYDHESSKFKLRDKEDIFEKDGLCFLKIGRTDVKM